MSCIVDRFLTNKAHTSLHLRISFSYYELLGPIADKYIFFDSHVFLLKPGGLVFMLALAHIDNFSLGSIFPFTFESQALSQVLLLVVNSSISRVMGFEIRRNL